MRNDHRKRLRRSLSERPQRQSCQRKSGHNSGGSIIHDRAFYDENERRRPGLNTKRIGFRKQKPFTRLESMKHVFAQLGLSENSSQRIEAEKSITTRRTWPSIKEADQSFTHRRITRRHSFAIESLIRPNCAKLEERTDWLEKIVSCKLVHRDVVGWQWKPEGTARVFMGNESGYGLYYWSGSATLSSRKCFIFGHKNNSEWRYVTNENGVLNYTTSDVAPDFVDLENVVTDPRVFYYEDDRLRSATQEDCWISLVERRGMKCLALDADIGNSIPWDIVKE